MGGWWVVACVRVHVCEAGLLATRGSAPPPPLVHTCLCLWPGARLSIAHAALHSPLAPRPDAPAVLWAAEGAPTQLQALSWAELRERCDAAAAAIAAAFQPGAC